MELHVPALSIVFMTISLIGVCVIPIMLLVFFRIKYRCSILPFFIGCAVMLLFAFVLEQLFHALILGSEAGIRIRGTTWMYALYGGCMAGLFEETGRFLAFRTILHKYQNNDANALMYGAGHGGFEAVVILGIAMLNNLILSIVLNLNMTESITGSLPPESLSAYTEAFQTLAESAPHIYLLGITERCSAILLHISLSVIVWFSVKNKRYPLFIFAIAFHAVADIVTVLLSTAGLNPWGIEAVIFLIASASSGIAYFIWKRERDGYYY